MTSFEENSRGRAVSDVDLGEVRRSVRRNPDVNADALFSALGINRQRLTDQSSVTNDTIDELFAVENRSQALLNYLPWTYLDHFLQKMLYFLFLSWGKHANKLWMSGQSILTKNRNQLRVTYAIDAMRKGIEDIVILGIHITTLSLAIYAIINRQTIREFLVENNESNFIFGLINLIARDAKLRVAILLPITALPGVWGICKAALYIHRTRLLLPKEYDNLLDHFVRPQKHRLYFHTVRWLLPLHPLSRRLTHLYYLLVWDGRLTVEQRQRGFAILEYTLREAPGYTPLEVMSVLLRIANSNHSHQQRLLVRPFESEQMVQVLINKYLSYQLIKQIATGEGLKERTKFMRWTMRVYATYCRWSLGYWQPLLLSLGLYIFKFTKTLFHSRIFVTLVQQIQNYLNCPKRPGYELFRPFPSTSYQWAIRCFNHNIEKIYETFPDEDVETLVGNADNEYAPLQQYDLRALKVLRLNNKGLSGGKIAKILTAFSNYNPICERKFGYTITLTGLDLSGNAINTPTEIRALFQALPKTVVQIDLSSNFIGNRFAAPNAYHLAVQALSEELKQHVQLENISIAHNSIGQFAYPASSNFYPDAYYFADALLSLPKLRALNISFNYFFQNNTAVDGLVNALNQSPLLESLDLSVTPFSEYGENFDYVAAWARLLPTVGRMPYLQVFRLQNGIFGNFGPEAGFVFARALQSIDQLRLLDLTTWYIKNSEVIKAFANSLLQHSQLQQLILTNNLFGFEGGEVSLFGVKVNLPLLALLRAVSQLKYLEVFNLDLNPLSLADSGALRISIIETQVQHTSRGLKNPGDIESFFLGYSQRDALQNASLSNLFYTMSEATMTELMDFLSHYKPILQLDLSSNLMGQSDVSATPTSIATQVFARRIQQQHCQTLTQLDLSNNVIGDTDPYGVLALIEAFANPRCFQQLEILNLGENALGFVDSTLLLRLIQSVAQLPKLRILYLDNNYLGYLTAISNEQAEATIASITQFPDLQELYLQYNYLGQYGQGFFKILNHLLQFMPSLRVLNLQNNFLGFYAAEDPSVLQNFIQVISQRKNLQILNTAENFIGYNNTVYLLQQYFDAVAVLNVPNFFNYGVVKYQEIQSSTAIQNYNERAEQQLAQACQQALCFADQLSFDGTKTLAISASSRLLPSWLLMVRQGLQWLQAKLQRLIPETPWYYHPARPLTVPDLSRLSSRTALVHWQVSWHDSSQHALSGQWCFALPCADVTITEQPNQLIIAGPLNAVKACLQHSEFQSDSVLSAGIVLEIVEMAELQVIFTQKGCCLDDVALPCAEQQAVTAVFAESQRQQYTPRFFNLALEGRSLHLPELLALEAYTSEARLSFSSH